MTKVFGHVDGVAVGAAFLTRSEVAAAGLHTPPMAGISGNAAEGADSVVASGGYADDEDHGDYIIYTGMGGRDRATGHQIADQSTKQHGNAGLITSELSGLPVRVVRGAGGDPRFSPPSGFRYDGLFIVAQHWATTGVDGFKIVQFRLERLPGQQQPGGNEPPESDPAYVKTTVTRRIRVTAVSRAVKALHQNVCQVCGNAVEVDGGYYAEGAHIRPLGRPHVGPDVASNILCLCPNHHVQLDLGGIVIQDDLSVVERSSGHALGTLRVVGGHEINAEHLAYHRSLWSAEG